MPIPGTNRNRNKARRQSRPRDTWAAAAAGCASGAGSTMNGSGNKRARRPSFCSFGFAGGAKESVLQVAAAGLLGKPLPHLRQASVDDLAPVLEDEHVRANFLQQMQQVRTDQNGR